VEADADPIQSLQVIDCRQIEAAADPTQKRGCKHSIDHDVQCCSSPAGSRAAQGTDDGLACADLAGDPRPGRRSLMPTRSCGAPTA